MRKQLSIFIVAMVVIALQAQAADLRVDIRSPSKNEEVAVETDVSGTVSNPSVRVYVLVRPSRTRDWWVQRAPAPTAQNGAWETRCYFGTETEGAGEPYEIVAIASKARLDLKEGQKLEDLPDKVAHSDVIKVRRKSS